MLGPCVGPSGWDPQPCSTTLWPPLKEMIGLVWQGKTCPIYNMGQCKRGSPLHHPSPLWTTRFSDISALYCCLGRGHFTFISIHVRKWTVIPLGHKATHIYLNKSIHVILSLRFSPIWWKICQWGKIISAVRNTSCSTNYDWGGEQITFWNGPFSNVQFVSGHYKEMCI